MSSLPFSCRLQIVELLDPPLSLVLNPCLFNDRVFHRKPTVLHLLKQPEVGKLIKSLRTLLLTLSVEVSLQRLRGNQDLLEKLALLTLGKELKLRFHQRIR
jgi:hypothetical protein